MNGWLTIKTRILTGPLKNGLNEITKMLTGANSASLAMVKSFAKITLILSVVLGVFKLFKGGMEALLNKNEELANKLQVIKLAFSNLTQGLFNAVANLIEPVITSVVNWIYKLMAYLNVITKQFFGIDLFAQKTEKSVAGTAKSLKSGAKSAKEINKQLAGFDEMNILTDSSTSAGGGGGVSGGGVGKIEPLEIPKVDTTEFEKFIKKFKERIGEMKDNFVKGWDFILNTNREDAKKLIEQSNSDFKGLQLGLFDMLHGISLFIDGIYQYWSGAFEFLKGLFTGNEEDIEKGVAKMKDGIIKILKGIVSFVASIPETIMGFAKDIGTKVGKYFKDKIDKRIEAIKKIPKAIKEAFKDGFWNGLLNLIKKGINKIIDKLNDKFTISIGKTLAAILRGLGMKVEAGQYHLINIPRLAKGGIVNNPGKGVMMGSYIAGEKGAEAVLPLTDDTLQKLASMIPITIDLTNTIDGRVLNRRLETIRMNDSFAGNR